MKPAKMLTVYAPERVNGRWITRGVIYTPLGQVRIVAEGSEDLARVALSRVQSMLQERVVAGDGDEVAGLLDDIKGAVVRVAKSKTYSQIFNTAQTVLRNPLLRKLAGKVPIVSNVLDGADAVFAIADGVKTGKLDAKSIVQKAMQLASSANPELAAQGQNLLNGIKVAKIASGLFAQVQRGNPEAREKVKQLKARAAQGDESAAAALTAYKRARGYRIREAAANTVQEALQGDAAAQKRIDDVYALARQGDKNAREAVRAMKKVVVQHDASQSQVAGISDDLTMYEREARNALSIGGSSSTYLALSQHLRELRQLAA